MLKELAVIFVITGITAIVIAVTFPPLILEPISWMLNSDIEVNKYGSAGLGNRTAQYFDFYIQLDNELYIKLSIFTIAILSAVIFTPVLIFSITLLSLHLKAKNKVKELRQSYLASLFEAFFEGKLKPAFWLIFCPLVSLIYFTKTEYHQDVINLSTYSYSIFDTKKIYKPATLTTYKNQPILWEVVLKEDHPIKYNRTDGGFSKVTNYTASIQATDNRDKQVFDYSIRVNSHTAVDFIHRYVVAINKNIISIIDTNSLQLTEISISDEAKTIMPEFNVVSELQYNPKNQKISLIDNHANKTKLSLSKFIKSPSIDIYPIIISSIQGKDHRAKQLSMRKSDETYESKQYFQPKVIGQSENFVLLKRKDKLNNNSKNIITLLDENLNESWNYLLASYNPYMSPFKNRDCKDLHYSNTKTHIAISYQFLGMTCATEFIDIKNGKLSAKYTTGSLEYL